MKTYRAYDKEGRLLNQYYVKSFRDLFNYMTVNMYIKTEYVRELAWDDKTTKNEDGSLKPFKEWQEKKCKKIYLHK